MITLKNKKELNAFIERIPEFVNILIKKMNEEGVEGNFEYFRNNIDDVQNFYKSYFLSYSQDEQTILQQAFWAFCAKILMEKLGGELVLATKTDFCTGTPIYINYGYKFDKKGKKKWIGIPFDSWFGSSTTRAHFRTLNMQIMDLIEEYGNTEE